MARRRNITLDRATRASHVKHSLLRRLEYCCWFVGGLALVWFALASWDSFKFQATLAKRLENLQKNSVKATPPKTGELFGRISIPRIGISAMIAEGVDESTLRHAVGHFPRTPTPEATGTVVLAAHRDTFFRGLARVHANDVIVLETAHGEYQYKVKHTAIVDPRHVEVLKSSPESDLTLVTCFPFHYTGPAPKRFIVQALRLPPA